MIQLNIFALFGILAAVLLVTAFFPDLFPRCSCCKKIKLRPSFRIHKITGIGLGYSASKSACRKCCKRYNISTLKELKQCEAIKQKIKWELENKNYFKN